MCEVASLTESSQPSAAAPPLLLVGIMGQTSSSGTAAAASTNNNNNHLQHASGASRNGKKIYHRHSTVQPALAGIRLLKKENSLTVGGSSSGAKQRDTILLHKARTESRNMDQYGLLLANGGATATTTPPTTNGGTVATTASSELTALLSATGSAADVDRSVTSVVGTSNAASSREFFKSGDDTYHRTDCCYYRTMDNGYHKLPSDSYHKTTEGCYVKMTDGSFRRLDVSPPGGGSATDGEEDGCPATNVPTSAAQSVQYRVRNPMLKFLKRSKSHTPATIAQLQKEKERSERKAIGVAASQHHRLSTIQSADTGGDEAAGRKQVAAAAAALLQHAPQHQSHYQTAALNSTPTVALGTSSASQPQPVLVAAAGSNQQQHAHQHHTHHHHQHHHHHHHSNSPHPPSASSIVEQQQQQQQPVVTKPQQPSAAVNHQNRRVMVTMIDGGLPVVAKSKPIHDRPKTARPRPQDVKREKVNSLLSQLNISFAPGFLDVPEDGLNRFGSHISGGDRFRSRIHYLHG